METVPGTLITMFNNNMILPITEVIQDAGDPSDDVAKTIQTIMGVYTQNLITIIKNSSTKEDKTVVSKTSELHIDCDVASVAEYPQLQIITQELDDENEQDKAKENEKFTERTENFISSQLKKNCSISKKRFLERKLMDLPKKQKAELPQIDQCFPSPLPQSIISPALSLLQQNTFEGYVTLLNDLRNQAIVPNKTRKTVPKSSEKERNHKFMGKKKVETDKKVFYGGSAKKSASSKNILEIEDKIYSCPKLNCRKTFANKFLLKKHEFIHTGLRPHKCPDCQKSFNRKDNLLRHKKTHISQKEIMKHISTTTRLDQDSQLSAVSPQFAEFPAVLARIMSERPLIQDNFECNYSFSQFFLPQHDTQV